MKQSNANQNDAGRPVPKVVTNSALQFIAQNGDSAGFGNQQQLGNVSNGGGVAQLTQRCVQEDAQQNAVNQNDMNGSTMNSPGPVGLTALCAACSRLYPNQPNPLQVTARVKYWLGGPDPLDYISMYWNPGRPDLNVPPHWHYVSFGLSDLHGDGRVHPPPDRVLLQAAHRGTLDCLQIQSGLGLEMTFRLRAEPGHPPPTWPAALLQNLARYVFRTGDHVSWHGALDGGAGRIRHMLVAADKQLGTVDTPLGGVQFVQIVGATGRELRAAQRGTGSGVLDMMAADHNCGGLWHVVDMSRSRTAAGLLVRGGGGGASSEEPSDLAGVSTVCRWTQWAMDDCIPEAAETESQLPQTVKEQIKTVLQKGLFEINQQPQTWRAKATEPQDAKMSTDSLKLEKRTDTSTDSLKMIFGGYQPGRDAAMSTDSFEMSKIEDALLEEVLRHEIPQIKEENEDMAPVKTEENDEFEGYTKCSQCQQYSGVATHPCRNCQSTSTAEQSSTNDTDFHRDLSSFNETGHSQEGRSWYGAGGGGGSASSEMFSVLTLKGIHLIFNAEGGSLIPLALRGRVLHGRHFTWRCAGGVQAITFVGAGVAGSLATAAAPYAATHHGWLQVLLSEQLARDMLTKMEGLSTVADSTSDTEEDAREQNVGAKVGLPATFQWPLHNLKITVLDNSTFI